MSNFKQMRLLMGLKQNELAKLAKVSPTTIATLEHKGIFDTRTAVKYAAVMRCNPIFLLDGLSIAK